MSPATPRPPRRYLKVFDPGNSLVGIEPGKHCEHRGQPRFATLQRVLDPVENALLASGQAHGVATPEVVIAVPPRSYACGVVHYPRTAGYASRRIWRWPHA